MQSKNEELIVLPLLRAAIALQPCCMPVQITPEKWGGVLRLAQANQVLPLVMETAERCGAPESISVLYRRQAMRLMASQTVRMHYMERLYAFLRERQLSFLVLEGALCSVQLPWGEKLSAAEERLLIRADEREQICAALLNFGMTAEVSQAKMLYSKDAVYASRDRQVYVGICSSLASLEQPDVFPDVWTGAVTIQLDEVTVPVLGPADRLLYGMITAQQEQQRDTLNLRRICDVLLTAQSGRDVIDWVAFAAHCRHIDLSGFAASLFAFGSKELGIDLADALAELRQECGNPTAILQALPGESGRIGTQQINSYENLSALRAMSTGGEEMKLFVSGGSMTPFLIHRRDSVYFRKPDRPLKRGDIVFFQRDSGQFVLHRILRVHGTEDAPLYDIVGDGQTQVERNVRRDQIFGLVVRAERKGKVLTPKSLWWKFFAGAWLRLLPLRPLLVKLYAALRGNRAAQSGENENK